MQNWVEDHDILPLGEQLCGIGDGNVFHRLRLGGQAAGSVLVECWDGTAVTANQVDPTAWHVSGRGDR